MNAVITGATRGIGKAITEKFCSEGFNVAVCARSKKDLESLHNDLNQKFPDAEIIAHPCDVSDKKQLKSFTDAVKLKWKSVEVLVNNAGTFLPGQVHREKSMVLEKLIKTNLYSAYYLTQMLIKIMIREKRGHIFNICSTASIQAYANGGSYSISKFALLGFSKNLRLEMIPYHIKVTAIIPGATLTGSWEGSELPAERFMKSEDIANAVWNAYTMSPQTVIEEIVLRPSEGDI
ncbi:MAG: SDR family oxidoreductase [Chitinophagales bacterium]